MALPFGVEEVAFLGEGTNEHWLVQRGDEELVVRRFRPIRSIAYAHYESALCNRLFTFHHPVPRVLDVAEVDDRIWMLMTRAKGEPGSYATDDQRKRGQLLAELHGGLSQLSGLGQREGRVFVDEVVNSPTLDGALAYYASLQPDEARILQWHVDRARTRFAEHDLATLPQSVVHGDFAPWNLLFTDGELTGIVDFDLSHLNYRAAEFALSWRGKYDDVVHGFNDVIPLTDAEWSLLAPIRWAWVLLFIEDAIEDMREDRAVTRDMEWVIQHLLRRGPLMHEKAYRA